MTPPSDDYTDDAHLRRLIKDRDLEILRLNGVISNLKARLLPLLDDDASDILAMLGDDIPKPTNEKGGNGGDK
jgi:hypothetical protein